MRGERVGEPAWRFRRLVGHRLRDFVFLELVVKGPTADAENARRDRPVLARSTKGDADGLLFGLAPAVIEARFVARSIAPRPRHPAECPFAGELALDVRRSDDRSVGQNDEPLDEV